MSPYPHLFLLLPCHPIVGCRRTVSCSILPPPPRVLPFSQATTLIRSSPRQTANCLLSLFPILAPCYSARKAMPPRQATVLPLELPSHPLHVSPNGRAASLTNGSSSHHSRSKSIVRRCVRGPRCRPPPLAPARPRWHIPKRRPAQHSFQTQPPGFSMPWRASFNELLVPLPPQISSLHRRPAIAPMLACRNPPPPPAKCTVEKLPCIPYFYGHGPKGQLIQRR
jgi:hypothetical protein